MHKFYLQTSLKESVKTKFDSLWKRENISKSELFDEAVDYFINHLHHKNRFAGKYQDIDRIRDIKYNISTLPDSTSKVKNLSEQLNINSYRLLREIICFYNENHK
jgi:hypothetical protein